MHCTLLTGAYPARDRGRLRDADCRWRSRRHATSGSISSAANYLFADVCGARSGKLVRRLVRRDASRHALHRDGLADRCQRPLRRTVPAARALRRHRPLRYRERRVFRRSARARRGTVHDEDRASYLREHLTAARSAIASGVKLRGYFVWSLMDEHRGGRKATAGASASPTSTSRRSSERPRRRTIFCKLSSRSRSSRSLSAGRGPPRFDGGLSIMMRSLSRTRPRTLVLLRRPDPSRAGASPSRSPPSAAPRRVRAAYRRFPPFRRHAARHRFAMRSRL